jgi:Ran GTPase-activating protein (RanGAP) involved in mRNA processing and transport
MQYKNIKLLDFSSNRSIQEGFFEQLGGMFTKPDFKLEVLHLENVDINESTAKKFLKDVTENRTLKVLNLSRNNLTDASVAPICEVLDQCQSLDSLYLHYNKIFGKGGMQIAEALEHNGNLQILDISFNALNGGIISKDQKQRSKLMASFAEAWAKCFKNNESLVHMDISHNNLNWD